MALRALMATSSGTGLLIRKAGAGIPANAEKPREDIRPAGAWRLSSSQLQGNAALVPTCFWYLLNNDALVRAWGFGPVVTIVVWSGFLRNKPDLKPTAMPQTYPDPIKNSLKLSQRIRMKISCAECKFCRNPADCYEG